MGRLEEGVPLREAACCCARRRAASLCCAAAAAEEVPAGRTLLAEDCAPAGREEPGALPAFWEGVFPEDAAGLCTGGLTGVPSGLRCPKYFWKKASSSASNFCGLSKYLSFNEKPPLKSDDCGIKISYLIYQFNGLIMNKNRKAEAFLSMNKRWYVLRPDRERWCRTA